MKIIIIGGVAVGATAATRLRRMSEDAEIIIFEKGPYISFANCGLPYHIGGVIEKRESLLLQTPETMRNRFNLDVRVKSEVTAINTLEKTVTVKRVDDGSVYTESYDKLILAPGAKPLVPPIVGIHQATNLFTLRDIQDTDKIIAFIEKEKPRRAVVVGGGFIGVEMAENLAERGLEISIVEKLPQLIPVMDLDIVQYIHHELEIHGIKLFLNNRLAEIQEHGKKIKLHDGTIIETDMIILSIGVAPDVKLASEAGLKLGKLGGIKVDDFMQTSDPHIYAGGDAIDVKCFVLQKPSRVPLAWPANRQARLIADNIMGQKRSYPGTLGTGIIKIFDKVAARTGSSETLLALHGVTNFTSIHIHPNNHAGYYPGATPVTLKLIFDKTDGRVLGAQAFGTDGVDKRIDVLATAIINRMTVYDLQELELAYAPPFGSAKDPVNMLGYVGANVVEGHIDPIYSHQLAGYLQNGGTLIDVRTAPEFENSHVEGAINIPLDNLRDNVSQLYPEKDYAVICSVGQRAYYANQILRYHGFTKVKLVSGGFSLYDIINGSMDE
jgi:NADPH-dependent 2,4-dienoyl-CoA reductase/sulfur reductase-like enzyme/rhodanese-related sulfurtransferase